eukprot:gnl/MRDRNA2_/MRDRNA2_31751_c0_seq1.p1 gnl/MRDRNA2_/MRDRNA2_31751_c0~~gnl/MRDRNA2_/MRDRNA2_31751_c0_seq1.p1  ORF type:complete len:536 (-),score=79.27 gnl/MRDRNA2_/MRDRNA2_31751_c0_seq1:33-1640(-)
MTETEGIANEMAKQLATFEANVTSSYVAAEESRNREAFEFSLIVEGPQSIPDTFRPNATVIATNVTRVISTTVTTTPYPWKTTRVITHSMEIHQKFGINDTEVTLMANDGYQRSLKTCLLSALNASSPTSLSSFDGLTQESIIIDLLNFTDRINGSLSNQSRRLEQAPDTEPLKVMYSIDAMHLVSPVSSLVIVLRIALAMNRTHFESVATANYTGMEELRTGVRPIVRMIASQDVGTRDEIVVEAPSGPPTFSFVLHSVEIRQDFGTDVPAELFTDEFYLDNLVTGLTTGSRATSSFGEGLITPDILEIENLEILGGDGPMPNNTAGNITNSSTPEARLLAQMPLQYRKLTGHSVRTLVAHYSLKLPPSMTDSADILGYYLTQNTDDFERAMTSTYRVLEQVRLKRKCFANITASKEFSIRKELVNPPTTTTTSNVTNTTTVPPPPPPSTTLEDNSEEVAVAVGSSFGSFGFVVLCAVAYYIYKKKTAPPPKPQKKALAIQDRSNPNFPVPNDSKEDDPKALRDKENPKAIAAV